MNRLTTAVALAAVLLLPACANSGVEGGEAEPKTSQDAPTTKPEPIDETTRASPAPSPEPEEPTPDVYEVDELLPLASADIVVNTLEGRDSIPTSYEGPFVPGDGERLWYVDITWTNNLPEAVAKECHGPYSMSLHAFDLQGREMLMVDQPGFIEGQNCSTGLMQDQTGTWLSAFRGLDEDFGWLVFDDYNGESGIVVLDPTLDLHYTD